MRQLGYPLSTHFSYSAKVKIIMLFKSQTVKKSYTSDLERGFLLYFCNTKNLKVFLLHNLASVAYHKVTHIANSVDNIFLGTNITN